MRQAKRRQAGEPASLPSGGGSILVFDRLRRADSGAARVLQLVATRRNVPTLLLLHPSRCGADVAAARQLAMYLMHVVLQQNYQDIGRFFGRDRTTVAHACAHIEDLRESAGFDAEVAELEAALAEAADAEEVHHAAR